MATADIQVKCFIIRKLICAVGHRVDYYGLLYQLILLSTCPFFKEMYSYLTFTGLIVETAKKGEGVDIMDSIVGHGGTQ